MRNNSGHCINYSTVQYINKNTLHSAEIIVNFMKYSTVYSMKHKIRVMKCNAEKGAVPLTGRGGL
jgi:hypothetical protein